MYVTSDMLRQYKSHHDAAPTQAAVTILKVFLQYYVESLATLQESLATPMTVDGGSREDELRYAQVLGAQLDIPMEHGEFWNTIVPYRDRSGGASIRGHDAPTTYDSQADAVQQMPLTLSILHASLWFLASVAVKFVFIAFKRTCRLAHHSYSPPHPVHVLFVHYTAHKPHSCTNKCWSSLSFCCRRN
jgi:hypothetical protein